MKFVKLLSGSLLNARNIDLMRIDKRDYYNDYVITLHLSTNGSNTVLHNSFPTRDQAEEELDKLLTYLTQKDD